MIHNSQGLLGRSTKLVPAAPRVMMRDSLVAISGKLIAISIVMSGGLCRGGNAIDPLSGIRQSTRPQHQDEHHRADQGLPP